MNPVPDQPKIYHITHVDKLAAIMKSGMLLSEAKLVAHQEPGAGIGMPKIKERRLRNLETCHAGDHVGDYVPFYFCPRSIMLYVIHCANNPGLFYRGGQGPVVHLEANLCEAVEWADAKKRRWCFSLSNAGAFYAEFRSSLDDLDEINWPAVQASDFRDPAVKEGKQAEFLIHDSFPWSLVRTVGVQSTEVKTQVERTLDSSSTRPKVTVQPSWYF